MVYQGVHDLYQGVHDLYQGVFVKHSFFQSLLMSVRACLLRDFFSEQIQVLKTILRDFVCRLFRT